MKKRVQKAFNALFGSIAFAGVISALCVYLSGGTAIAAAGTCVGVIGIICVGVVWCMSLLEKKDT